MVPVVTGGSDVIMWLCNNNVKTRCAPSGASTNTTGHLSIGADHFYVAK